MILSSTSPYALLNEFYIACGKAEQYRFSQFSKLFMNMIVVYKKLGLQRAKN